MIQTHQLTKQFGEFTAVKDVTLEVMPGEILVLLGPNGAGKTTTVRMLSSILHPTSGRATVAGYDTVAEAAQVRHHVGLLTELPGLYTRMNAQDYLDFFARLQFMPKGAQRHQSEALLRRFGLWEFRQQPISTYSKGMRQKLALSRALIHEPPVVLLDEPTSAMDPHSAKTVRDHITALAAAGRSIILCTHNLSEAEAMADRIAIINHGQIVAQGAISELKRKLLGVPLFELRLKDGVERVLPSLDGMVHIEEQGERWLRYSAPEPEVVNPLLLRRLVEGGVEVVSLGEVPRSLETVYLRIVGED